MVRLNKYLADCGIASRRKCDQLILDGKVSVNGVPEIRLGTKIDEKADKVAFEGKLLRSSRRFEYYVVNKPCGYVTSVSDEKGRKAVVDLVRSRARLFPVGRLDLNTSGLIILTNDGDFAYQMTHPKFGVRKTYLVKVARPLTEQDKRALERGVELEEGVTGECRIEFRSERNQRVFEMTIHQGWNRQIRRMLEVIGHQVMVLKRIAFGTLEIGNMRAGSCRVLNHDEVGRLKSLVELVTTKEVVH
jgi:23S rRNA pseudouridine2605 synthase